MAVARITVEDLSPAELEQRGQKLIVEGHRCLVRAELARANGANDWIDQNHSPLGKRKHLRLAQAGKLPSRKVGRRVFVRREDIDAYLEKFPMRGRREKDEDVDDIIERVKKDEGGKRR